MGFYKLVQVSVIENVKYMVLYCIKKELFKDFKLVLDFDQFVLFKNIYESEYGMFGGILYFVFVGDFYFDNILQDIDLLEYIFYVVVSVYVLFLSVIVLGMLFMSLFSELFYLCDLVKLFEIIDYVCWCSFRQIDDSCYVGLILLQLLGCILYGMKIIFVEMFNFEEYISEDNLGKDYLWVNIVFEFVCWIVDVFEEYGWCVVIWGVEGGGLVKLLSVYNYVFYIGE